MNPDEPTEAVMQGRRVAMALLLAAMASTIVLVAWAVAWWATRPVVI